MKSRKNYATAFILATITAALAGGYVYAATEHFSDSTTDQAWDAWTQKWEGEVSCDYEKIALTPGADESKLNFAWYSKTDGAATPRIELSKNSDLSQSVTYDGNAVQAVEGYQSNRVT
ncbi:MAG: serine/threonine protein phosphatase, partial [Paenibacillaceae bacterium]|nr:serine/threonine protein phosphatase [Paenibacillaceae bacterium]